VIIQSTLSPVLRYIDKGDIAVDGRGRKAFIFRIDPDHFQAVFPVFFEPGTYRFFGPAKTNLASRMGRSDSNHPVRGRPSLGDYLSRKPPACWFRQRRAGGVLACGRRNERGYCSSENMEGGGTMVVSSGQRSRGERPMSSEWGHSVVWISCGVAGRDIQDDQAEKDACGPGTDISL
jgi:hypothetical protein